MSTATVYVLGSGTCYPEPGRTKRAPPGFYIRYGARPEEHLLLECSAGIAERLEAIGVGADQIGQLAISHAHPDHFALPQFLQSAHCAYSIRSRGEPPSEKPVLELFVPHHIKMNLRRLNEIHFEETCFAPDRSPGLAYPIVNATDMTDHQREHGVLVSLAGGASLRAFPVQHGFGKVDALAFRLALKDGTCIAYSGDTGMCQGVIEAARNADLLICEASARVGDNESATRYGHLNPFQAGQVAKLAGAKSLLLTHYSGSDSDELILADCLLSSYEGDVTLAKDGMSINV